VHCPASSGARRFSDALDLQPCVAARTGALEKNVALHLWILGAVFRGAGEEFLSIRQNDASGIDGIRSILCPPSVYRYCISSFQRVLAPATSVKAVGRSAFDGVVGDLAAGVVLYVDIEVDVGICPFHLRNLAGEFNGFASVVFRSERMMGKDGNCGHQQTEAETHN